MTRLVLTGRAREERWGWEVRGESRWERVWRAMDFGELATNLRINLSAAEGSPKVVVVVRVERKRWACLVSAHLGNNGVSFCGGAL